MKLIDMHCDTIGKIMDLDKKGNLGENFCSVTISEMKRAKSLAPKCWQNRSAATHNSEDIAGRR